MVCARSRARSEGPVAVDVDTGRGRRVAVKLCRDRRRRIARLPSRLYPHLDAVLSQAARLGR